MVSAFRADGSGDNEDVADGGDAQRDDAGDVAEEVRVPSLLSEVLGLRRDTGASAEAHETVLFSGALTNAGGGSNDSKLSLKLRRRTAESGSPGFANPSARGNFGTGLDRGTRCISRSGAWDTGEAVSEAAKIGDGEGRGAATATFAPLLDTVEGDGMGPVAEAP
mmetsp:Transcript_39253/g.69586  ORF Transcript_39253/g.69586 Transcript_39253/m.69586 type:complete len:165 (-) Transcript_39253:128-622(-)